MHFRNIPGLFLLSPLLLVADPVFGQADPEVLSEQLLDLHKVYKPKSMLQVDENPRQKPKFPVADIHSHWPDKIDPIELINSMDKLGISYAVNLSGGWGTQLDRMLERFKKPYPDRFEILVNINFSEIDRPDFSEKWTRFLVDSKKKGAAGLKIFKNLGLTLRDLSGQIIPIDDPRLDPIWGKCGELGMPVLIHTADPLAFFQPIDRFNERLMQLGRHPDWSFYGSEFPSREEVIRQRNHILERHPNTTFIGAHVGNSAEDLTYASYLLDNYPNFFVDISGRVAELGRQPYSARKFILKYADRILFGTDRYPGRPDQPRYQVYYRFLETADEYFDYHEHEFPPTGEWKIYGIFLPDAVLEKIYHLNADRLFGK